MEINVENTSSLGRKLTIKIEKETVFAVEQEKIKDYSKNLKVDGFRTGKIPLSVLKQRYGKQIRKEVVASLIEKTLFETIEKENLDLADKPVITQINDQANEDLSFIALMEVLPHIELQDYVKIEVEKEIVEISEEDVKTSIYKLKEQLPTWEPKSGTSAIGDKVTIDIESFVDGKPFESGFAKDYAIELGVEEMLPGLQEGLLGVSIGDKKDVAIKFPEEYAMKSVAGKEAILKVTVKNLECKKPAELNEDFAKRIGILDGDISKIDEEIKARLEKNAKEVVETKIRDRVLKKLLELHPIEIPEVFIKRESHVIKQELQRKNILNKPEEDIVAAARERVAISLLLHAVIEKHNLRPDENRVEAKIRELSAMFGHAAFVAKLYSSSKELIGGINNTVLIDQATDLLLENATIKEKQASLQDIGV